MTARSVGLSLPLVLALVAWDGAPGAAQSGPERASADASVAVAEAGSADEPAVASSDGGAGFWGSRSPRRRIIPALWGMHFFDRQSLRPFWTRGGGLQAAGWFFGVFENSYDDLSAIAGVEREWGAWRAGSFGLGAGYRAGLITGYDGQLFALADKTPVLPFAGLDVWVQAGPIGVDVFYVYRALSVEAWIRY
jgi:hypothetical protein